MNASSSNYRISSYITSNTRTIAAEDVISRRTGQAVRGEGSRASQTGRVTRSTISSILEVVCDITSDTGCIRSDEIVAAIA